MYFKIIFQDPKALKAVNGIYIFFSPGAPLLVGLAGP